jgi:UDP-2,3-diacylglucosamine pyrophosphatase LpxH
MMPGFAGRAATNRPRGEDNLGERAMDLPHYDELHVVSDLHMGGPPGFQILREGKRLGGFIDWVGKQRPQGRVALVLNGDVIDSLAEDIGGYVAVADAVAMVERIFAYDTFKPVWDALAAFVAKPLRTLVIVIGNHDIELAFPPVQRAILARLAGDNLEARARIEFSTMGAGYPCLVGDASVFCTHGNEVDPWNYNRYEDLSRAARRLNAGRTLDPSEWQPNAGTKMVKDVMNQVKRKYAWIDLLKPEAQAAVGVLLVLDPAQVSKINRLIPIIGEKARGDQQVDQRLSADGFSPSAPAAAAAPHADQLLGPNLTQGMKAGPTVGVMGSDQLLLQVEKSYQTRGTGMNGGDDTLGTGQLVWDRLTGWITGMGKDEALRRALKDWLSGDKTFQVDAPDDTYKAVIENTGAAIDFIVTGHTHLERAISRGGGRYYFNTGTWIRLLRFDDTVLANAASFQPVYKVLTDGTMKAIDEASFGGKPFVMDQSSAVRIRADNTGTIGELVHVTGDGTQSMPVGAPFRRG